MRTIRIAWWFALFVALVPPTPAIANAVAPLSLNALVKQNATSASNAYQRYSNQIVNYNLWIEVRTTVQENLVEQNLGWLRGIRLQSRPITIEPLQVLNVGPDGNELRFFKKEDAGRAQQLQQTLARGVQNLQLRDMSGAYSKVPSVNVGRFELWLAPGVTQFGSITR